MLSLGKIFENDDPKRTRLLYGKAEKIILDTDYKLGKARALRRYSKNLISLGEKKQAMLLLRESLSIIREIGAIGDEVFTIDALADLLQDIGDFDKAIDMYLASYRICNEIGNAEMSILSFQVSHYALDGKAIMDMLRINTNNVCKSQKPISSQI